MAKKIKTILKLQVPAGEATPGPPLGPSLGQHGVNIGQFVTRFNEDTKDRKGDTLPVVLTIFEDRSFEFQVREPLVSSLLRKAARVEKGSGEPNRNKVGRVSRGQLREIAARKIKDMNTEDIESAIKVVAGTARSMGIDVE